MAERGYTFEVVRDRAPILDAPFTCSATACGEALPAPPAWRRGAFRDLRCPRCGEAMHRAPYARVVERTGTPAS